MLFAGDIESSVQKELADIFGDGLMSHILKVPHHGGGDNMTEFIKRVKPDIAVISVGQNIYNAPDPSVIEGYKDIGAKVMRTDIEGTIIIDSDGINIKIIK
ncbi:MAG: ComEC/Rec2 family competence protein [Nitrospirota bacterium]